MTKDDYLNRDMQRGITLTFLNQLIKIALSLVSLPLLARYLDPSDFGYFAIIFSLFILFDLVRDLGISVGQLGKKDSTDRQKSEYFWISTISGVFFFAVSVVFYFITVSALNVPNYFFEFLILNSGLIINGFGSQFLLDLRFELRFKVIAGIEFLANFLSIIVAITLALTHSGIWALVIQQMLLSLMTTLLAFLFSDFRPLSYLKTRPHFTNIKNGLWMSASQVLDILSRSLTTLQLGREFSLTDMGMYDRAQQLQNIPNNALNIPARNVALPILRRVMFNPENLQKSLMKTQFVILNIAFLIYSFLFINASEIIDLLYGSKYVASVPIFEILLIIGMVQSASHVGIWVTLISQLNKSNLYLSLVNLIIVFGLVQIGLEFGLLPALVSLLFANVLKTGAIFQVARRNSGLNLNKLFLQGFILFIAYLSVALLLAYMVSFLTSLLVGAAQFVLSALLLLLFSSLLLSISHTFPNGGRNDFRVLLSLSRRLFKN
jgi:O-antigen/teichoic acid export membrane protein